MINPAGSPSPSQSESESETLIPQAIDCTGTFVLCQERPLVPMWAALST